MLYYRNLDLILSFMKKSTLTRLGFLAEMTAYDEPNKVNRFSLVYQLLSIEYN